MRIDPHVIKVPHIYSHNSVEKLFRYERSFSTFIKDLTVSLTIKLNDKNIRISQFDVTLKKIKKIMRRRPRTGTIFI